VRENQGRQVDSLQIEGFLRKNTTRRGIGSSQLLDLKPTAEIRSAGERTDAGAGAHCPVGQGGQRPRRGGRTDWPGLVLGAQATNRRVRTKGARVLELALLGKLIQRGNESNVNKVSTRDGNSSVNPACQGHFTGVFIGA
jgi:hypothetical protein